MSLATRWTMSSDGLECTYSLRHGVQFADGRPFTSADVQFSFDVVHDPAVPAESLRALLVDVVSVRAPDSFTIIATFRERSWRAPLVFGNALRILNKGWYEEELPIWAHRVGLRENATEALVTLCVLDMKRDVNVPLARFRRT